MKHMSQQINIFSGSFSKDKHIIIIKANEMEKGFILFCDYFLLCVKINPGEVYSSIISRLNLFFLQTSKFGRFNPYLKLTVKLI